MGKGENGEGGEQGREGRREERRREDDALVITAIILHLVMNTSPKCTNHSYQGWVERR